MPMWLNESGASTVTSPTRLGLVLKLDEHVEHTFRHIVQLKIIMGLTWNQPAPSMIRINTIDPKLFQF